MSSGTHPRHALVITAAFAVIVWPTDWTAIGVLVGLLWALYLAARDDAHR